jgi:23S rRNA (cytosine1962-C5)-methyltransferase
VSLDILSTQWPEYELIDSGDRRKLERFGDTIIIRSEPKAWWKPDTGNEQWERAQAEFDDNSKNWKFFRKKVKKAWQMKLLGLQFEARLTDMSKHLGLFPEQEPHWSWMHDRIQQSGRDIRFLNLFGYTGVASLVAAKAGAKVTHVDASKPAIGWGRENQQRSGIGDAPIRWILDDVVKYARREIRRNSLYDAIILDPPSFGRGPKGEVWKVEEQIAELMGLVKELLTETPLFVVVTMYNLEASALMVQNLVSSTMKQGICDSGELALKHKYSDKYLPLSIYTRWEP